MTTLRLGVIDIPYAEKRETASQQRSRAKKNRKAPAAESEAVSTGDVAEILEEKYHIMEHFFEASAERIGDVIAHSLAGALETVMQGGSNGPPPYAAAESEIKEAFDQFITLGLMENLGYPGVPTKAALDGVSHRFKRPHGKHPRRPSFVDTGLYLASFIAEIDG
jgi:hypothetical protein